MNRMRSERMRIVASEGSIRADFIRSGRSPTYNAIETIALLEKEQFRKAVLSHHFIGAHNNLNLEQEIYEQRLDSHIKRGHTDGTVGLGISVDDPAFPFPFKRETLAESLAAGRMNPLTASEVAHLEMNNSQKLAPFMNFFILSCLVQSSEFDLSFEL